ncbi:nucleotide-diphospho-sugar transferase family protein isoform X2 [Wolffia australiana]
MRPRKKRYYDGHYKRNNYSSSMISAAIVVAFVLICIAFFLFVHEDAAFETPEFKSLPSIEIFTAPRFNYNNNGNGFSQNCRGEEFSAMELAIRSWLALSPKISVVLYGHGSCFMDFNGVFGPRVTVESAKDFTFMGTPLFSSLVARAQASKADISVLIDPDTILFPDFISALQSSVHLNSDWLLVSIPQTFSFDLKVNSNRIKFSELQNILAIKSESSECGDRAVIAWNKGKRALQPLVWPSFITGKGFHNQWLIHEALSSELRLVVDASLTVSGFYPQTFNESKWEISINAKLAASYGSFQFRPSNNFNLLKLVQCSGRHLFYYAANNTIYFDKVQEQTHSWANCLHHLSLRESCSVPKWLKVKMVEETQVALPFSLESLLRIVADENKTVVLGIAGNNYRDILMSWVCRLRHLSVSNFIVAAIDTDIYDFSVLQGLPVFKDPFAPTEIGLKDCHFGTTCFQRVTKVKSRLVLHLLQMGYNVLLSDVDVYWFQNPLPFLRAFEPPVLLAQSDEFNEIGPINLSIMWTKIYSQ